MKNEFTNTKFCITINRRHIQIRGIRIEPIIWIQIQFRLTYCRLNILINLSKMIYNTFSFALYANFTQLQKMSEAKHFLDNKKKTCVALNASFDSEPN